MQTERRWGIGPAVCLALICLAWGATIAANAPGHLSFDSVVQLHEGRSRIFESMHPPVMSLLLGLLDFFQPGTALFLLFSASLFFGALLIAAPGMRQKKINPFLLALVTVCLIAPTTLIYQGIIWKDVLFANATVLAFATASAARRNASHRRRLVLWIAAGMAAGLAVTIRQQGLLVPFALAAAALPGAWGLGRRRAVLEFIGILGVSFLAAYAFILGVHAWSKAPPPNVNALGMRALQTFDIIGMTAFGAPLPQEVGEEDRNEIQSHALRHYTGARIDEIDAPKVPVALGGAGATLADTWWEMASHSPVAYAKHRLLHFRWLVLPRQLEWCLPFHLGISASPSDLVQALGLSAGLRPIDHRILWYTTQWLHTPVFYNATWLLACCAIAVVLLRRRISQPGDSAILALQLLAIVFASTYLVVGIACDFRYLYLAPTSALVGLVHLMRRTDA